MDKKLRDLRDLNLLIKQADKNLGLVAIRGDIHNGMTRARLAAPSFEKVNNIPHDDLLRRLKNIVNSNKNLRIVGRR